MQSYCIIYLFVFTAKQMGRSLVRLLGLRTQAMDSIARGSTVWRPALKSWGGPTTATSDALHTTSGAPVSQRTRIRTSRRAQERNGPNLSD